MKCLDVCGQVVIHSIFKQFFLCSIGIVKLWALHMKAKRICFDNKRLHLKKYRTPGTTSILDSLLRHIHLATICSSKHVISECNPCSSRLSKKWNLKERTYFPKVFKNQPSVKVIYSTSNQDVYCIYLVIYRNKNLRQGM